MKRSRLVISGAWLLQALAWGLPVVAGSHARVPGWEAFRVAFTAVWPYQHFSAENWYGAVLATASAVSTLLFIFGSPWVVLRGSPSLNHACGWVAAIAFVVNAHWYVLNDASSRSDLRIGYFLWWLSFALLAIGLFLAGHNRGGESREGRAA